MAAPEPTRIGPPCHGSNVNGGGSGSFQPPAKYVERFCWSCRRMLTEKPLARWIACPMWAFFATQNRTSGGSSESDVNAFAVIPLTSPSMFAATTVTPVTNWPTVFLNSRGSMCAGFVDIVQLHEGLLHDRADVAIGDEVGYFPAIDVILGHALLGEALVALRRPRHVGHEQRLEPDAFVVPEVVPLVELVTSAELGADGVPHQLHQLHAVDGFVAVAAADELIEEGPELRHFEVESARWQVDERAGEAVLDDLLDLRIRDARHHAVRQPVIEVRQHVAFSPRNRRPRHRVGEAPEAVPPREDFADLRLHTAEFPGAR